MKRTDSAGLISLHFRMNPDCALMATSLQEVNRSEDGHMAPKAWGEIGNDPVNVQMFCRGVVVDRPIGLQRAALELQNFLETIDLQFIASFDDSFIG